MRVSRRFRPGVQPHDRRVLLSASPARAWAAAEAAAQAQAADTPPVIQGATEVIQNRAVVAFQIEFTKPVNPSPLSDLGHYALFEQAPGRASGGSPVPLASAAYNPLLQTLTLTPAAPAPVAHYLLKSPDANDPSTDFITDAQGRPLLTPSKTFTVYFQPSGVDLRNLVWTSSSVVNHETGASFIFPAFATIRSAERLVRQENNQLTVSDGLVGGSAVAGLLLRSLP